MVWSVIQAFHPRLCHHRCEDAAEPVMSRPTCRQSKNNQSCISTLIFSNENLYSGSKDREKTHGIPLSVWCRLVLKLSLLSTMSPVLTFVCSPPIPPDPQQVDRLVVLLSGAIVGKKMFEFHRTCKQEAHFTLKIWPNLQYFNGFVEGCGVHVKIYFSLVSI